MKLRGPLLWMIVFATGPALWSCAGTEGAVKEPDTQEWRLVWSDEFEGAKGTALDASKWGYDVGGHGWGNKQLEFNREGTSNAALDGEGNLAITARKETYEKNEYTSARILTKGKFEHTYGKIEARIKLPKGQGIWPAFWMLGADFPEVGWPACGEIDILEYRGQDVASILGSLHGPGYSGGDPISRGYSLSEGGFDENFHVFGVTWDPGRIAWHVDGEIYGVATPGSLPNGAEWVFNHPFFIIMNVAVGGNFVGDVGPNTEFPQAMLVDWVRVYAR